MTKIPSTNKNFDKKNDVDNSNKWQMTQEDELELAAKNITLPLSYEHLKRYLPHRYPFMLVDRVTACRSNEWVCGYKNVTINEPFFQGHFPDQPIMPGVLIVEALAQVSGVLAFVSEGVTAEDGYLFLFAGIDKVRFKRPVIPGDKLILISKFKTQKSNIGKFDCQALVEGEVAATAELMIIRKKQ